MAQRLNQGLTYSHPARIFRSPSAPRFIAPEPGSAEYELYMDGQEPDVQLFLGASEFKEAPNYSDWLFASSQPKEA